MVLLKWPELANASVTVQVVVVPLIDGLLGASIPRLTWFGAIMSLFGIGLLECGGSPPSVSNNFVFTK